MVKMSLNCANCSAVWKEGFVVLCLRYLQEGCIENDGFIAFWVSFVWLLFLLVLTTMFLPVIMN